MGGILSFLGGSAFRMLWGEVSTYFTKKQEHQQEIERIKLQAENDAARHIQECERIKLQSDLGVKEMYVQHDIDIDKLNAEGFMNIAENITKPIGIAFIDGWNSSIRPMGATMALIMIAAEIVQAGFVIPAAIAEVLFAFLGLYVADRSLGKRGK